MKANRFIMLLILTLAPGTLMSQEYSNGSYKSYFSELNFGIASLNDGLFYDNNEIWPGLSFLWGITITDDSGFIFEYSAGFAFPSIVTGKIGVGKKINRTKLILGIRPYPSNIYLQSSFAHKERGYWTASIEYNPLDTELGISLHSRMLITLSYRWHSNKSQ